MRNTPLRLLKPVPSPDALSTSPVGLSVTKLERFSQDWLYDCEFRQHSQQTLALRRHVLEKLIWLLRERECERCGPAEIRQFLAYLTTGHKEPGGRWGNPRFNKPA